MTVSTNRDDFTPTPSLCDSSGGQPPRPARDFFRDEEAELRQARLERIRDTMIREIGSEEEFILLCGIASKEITWVELARITRDDKRVAKRKYEERLVELRSRLGKFVEL